MRPSVWLRVAVTLLQCSIITAQVSLGCSGYNSLTLNTEDDEIDNGIHKNRVYTTCRDSCRRQNKVVFGIKRNGVTADYANCYCGDEVPTVSSSGCGYRCDGNVCGGSGKISVYSMCSARRNYGTGCAKWCYCGDNQPCRFQDGFCPNGCDSTYYGPSCDMTDINECQASTNPCGDRRCQNSAGSYMCEACPQGRRIVPNDWTSCQDIDECVDGTSGCNQTCTNTDGSYTCSCMAGYRLAANDHDCLDNNECSFANGGCDQNCQNTVGSFYCYCDPGYSVDDNDALCSDIDECVTNNGGCDQTCNNNPGSYQCLCKDGFTVNTNNMHLCDDVDECALGTDECEDICFNTIGSYSCDCPPGYYLDETKHCTDIDECANNNGGCAQNCHNNPGSFSCSCQGGFRQQDKTECIDVDECAEKTHDCDQECENTDGSFTCSCTEGFTLQDGVCQVHNVFASLFIAITPTSENALIKIVVPVAVVVVILCVVSIVIHILIKRNSCIKKTNEAPDHDYVNQDIQPQPKPASETSTQEVYLEYEEIPIPNSADASYQTLNSQAVVRTLPAGETTYAVIN